MMSQTTFPGVHHAGEVRRDVLRGQMRVEVDGRADRGVAEGLGERLQPAPVRGGCGRRSKALDGWADRDVGIEAYWDERARQSAWLADRIGLIGL